MIVKPISDIKWFLEHTELINSSYNYDCVWHKNQKQKTFTALPTFVGKFSNVTAHSLPFLLTEQKLMLTEHVWPLLWKTKHKPQKTHNLWKQWGEKIEIAHPKITRRLNEKDTYVWMPIDSESSNNAWHFWIDIWSRIKLINDSMSCRNNPQNYIYIFPNTGDYITKAMDQLFPNFKYMVMPKNEYWLFDELIVPSMSNNNDGVLTPGLPIWLSKIFPPAQKPFRKIFISRKDAEARQLSNSEELFMVLKGWQMVNLSELDLKQQIKLFGESTHIMSTHGAGLVNTVWAKEGAKVIEISQTELADKKPYPILSMLKKHQHHVVFADKIKLGKSKPKNVKRLKDYNNLRVDISKIISLI
jgi:hypothetical protein